MFIKEQMNLAVIGCGYWGKNYIRLLSQMADVNLVAICDRDKEQLRKNKTRILSSQSGPRLQLFTDYQKMLEMEDLNGVIICTNPNTHHQLAVDALNAGKHVFLEQPMTLKSESAQHLIDLAKEKELILMVGHIFLYNSAVLQIKDYIEKGQLGTIYYLYSKRTNLGPIRPDVNALWDLAPHDISIFNYLLDETPAWVSATATSFLRENNQDVGFITLGYPSGKVGHIHVSWADPHKEREVVVVGSKQRVVFNDVSPGEKVRIFEKGVSTSRKTYEDYGEFQLSFRDGEIISPAIPFSEPLRSEVEHFIQCINYKSTPRSDGENGLIVVQIMEAIDQSLAEKGVPVYLK
jgi:predicted dehydrogenase